jgi:hypothetical protein
VKSVLCSPCFYEANLTSGEKLELVINAASAWKLLLPAVVSGVATQALWQELVKNCKCGCELRGRALSLARARSSSDYVTWWQVLGRDAPSPAARQHSLQHFLPTLNLTAPFSSADLHQLQKSKGGLCGHHTVCLCIPLIDFRTAGPIFTKLGTYEHSEVEVSRPVLLGVGPPFVAYDQISNCR